MSGFFVFDKKVSDFSGKLKITMDFSFVSFGVVSIEFSALPLQSHDNPSSRGVQGSDIPQKTASWLDEELTDWI